MPKGKPLSAAHKKRIAAALRRYHGCASKAGCKRGKSKSKRKVKGKGKRKRKVKAKGKRTRSGRKY